MVVGTSHRFQRWPPVLFWTKTVGSADSITLPPKTRLVFPGLLMNPCGPGCREFHGRHSNRSLLPGGSYPRANSTRSATGGFAARRHTNRSIALYAPII